MEPFIYIDEQIALKRPKIYKSAYSSFLSNHKKKIYELFLKGIEQKEIVKELGMSEGSTRKHVRTLRDLHSKGGFFVELYFHHISVLIIRQLYEQGINSYERLKTFVWASPSYKKYFAGTVAMILEEIE